MQRVLINSSDPDNESYAIKLKGAENMPYSLHHFYKTDARIFGSGGKLIFLLSSKCTWGDPFNFFKGGKKSIA